MWGQDDRHVDLSTGKLPLSALKEYCEIGGNACHMSHEDNSDASLSGGGINGGQQHIDDRSQNLATTCGTLNVPSQRVKKVGFKLCTCHVPQSSCLIIRRQ